MLSEDEIVKLLASFESLGEEKVRENLASKIYSPQKQSFAENWLNEKARSQKNNKKELELNLAREANKIARSSRNASWAAIIISIIALLVAVLIAIFK